MLTPVNVNKYVEGTYVSLDQSSTVITNFEASAPLSIVGTTGWPNGYEYDPKVNRFNTSMGDSVSAFISSVTGSTSSHYNSIGMTLFARGLDDSLTSNLTGVCKDIGVVLLKKRKIDYGIKKGSLLMTATGTSAAVFGSVDISGDYYDDGLGNVLKSSDDSKIGVVDYDTGLIVITQSDIREVAVSLTSITYNPVINMTNISVFCTAEANELNYSLNHTFFDQESLSSSSTEQRYNNLYTSLPLTASTSASVFDPRFSENDENFRPYITSVGLYDDNNECLAIAKLTRPIRKPSDLPITFKVSIDI